MGYFNYDAVIRECEAGMGLKPGDSYYFSMVNAKKSTEPQPFDL